MSRLCRSLLLIGVALCLFGLGAQAQQTYAFSSSNETSSAGALLTLSRTGLQRAADVLLPDVLTQLSNFTIESQTVEESGFRFLLTNIRVTDVVYNDSEVSLDDVIAVQINGLDVTLEFDYDYENTNFPFVPSGDGAGSIFITDSTVTMTADGRTQNSSGRVVLEVLDTAVVVPQVDFQFRDDPFSGLIGNVVNGNADVKNLVAGIFTDAVVGAVDDMAGMLPNLTSVTSLFGLGKVDLNLVSEPIYYNNQTVSLPVRAVFMPEDWDENTAVPIERLDFNATLSGRPIDIVLSEFSLNSALWALTYNQSLNFRITQDDLPAGLPIKVDTNTLAVITPPITTLCPLGSCPIVLDLEVTDTPTVVLRQENELTDGVGYVFIPHDLTLHVVDRDGDMETAYVLSSVANVTFTVGSDDNATIFAHVHWIGLDYAIKSSNVGDFSTVPLNTLLLSVANSFLIRELNSMASNGYALPDLYGFVLDSPQVNISEHYLHLNSHLDRASLHTNTSLNIDLQDFNEIGGTPVAPSISLPSILPDPGTPQPPQQTPEPQQPTPVDPNSGFSLRASTWIPALLVGVLSSIFCNQLF